MQKKFPRLVVGDFIFVWKGVCIFLEVFQIICAAAPDDEEVDWHAGTAHIRAAAVKFCAVIDKFGCRKNLRFRRNPSEKFFRLYNLPIGLRELSKRTRQVNIELQRPE